MVMLKTLPSLVAPLLSIMIVMLGSGLLNSFIPIRLALENVPFWGITLVSSAYYAGLVLGSFRCAHFILRVGHIRAYATFASIAAVITLLLGLWVSVWSWMILRMISGSCYAGLFIVIESWMINCSTPETRGRFLAIYMVAVYAAQALGQFFLNFGEPKSLLAYALVTIFISLSVVPVTMTTVSSPQMDEPEALGIKDLFRISPSGVLGCWAAGMFLGPVYALIPVTLRELHYTMGDVAAMMSCTIFGGMMLQYPVGYLSDRLDRRKMLVINGLCLLVASMAIVLSYDIRLAVFVMLFLFGGAAFSVFPIAMSHACDTLDSSAIVGATQGLFLAYGLGCIAGPLTAQAFLWPFGPVGLYVYFMVLATFLIVFFYQRIVRRVYVEGGERQLFVPTAGVSPIAFEMDPRAVETNNSFSSSSPPSASDDTPDRVDPMACPSLSPSVDGTQDTASLNQDMGANAFENKDASYPIENTPSTTSTDQKQTDLTVQGFPEWAPEEPHFTPSPPPRVDSTTTGPVGNVSVPGPESVLPEPHLGCTSDPGHERPSAAKDTTDSSK